MIFTAGPLIARKPEHKDLEAIYGYRNDPKVYETLGGHYTGLSREDVKSWIDFHRLNKEDLVWVLATKDQDLCVGHVGLYRVDYRRGKAEIGLALSRLQWGKGLGGAIYGALINHAFLQLRLHRLETFNLETNLKIIKIKENLGFKLDGVLRESEFRNGRWLNVMCMSILESEWQGIPDNYNTIAG